MVKISLLSVVVIVGLSVFAIDKASAFSDGTQFYL